MHTKLPNKSAGSLFILHTLHKYALRQTSLEYTGLYRTSLLESIYFALHQHSLSINFFILHIISISHWISSLHYQLHEDMKFLAITSHRCEESWMVLIWASSRLLGLSNFHLLAEAVALKTPTGFLLGESVMRLWWWGLFVVSSNWWRLSCHLLLVMYGHANLWTWREKLRNKRACCM